MPLQPALHAGPLTPIIPPPHTHRRDETLYYQPQHLCTRFGLRVRQYRMNRQLTQLQLATRLGLDRSFISDLERGRKAPSLPTMEIIALGFHMSISELCNGL